MSKTIKAACLVLVLGFVGCGQGSDDKVSVNDFSCKEVWMKDGVIIEDYRAARVGWIEQYYLCKEGRWNEFLIKGGGFGMGSDGEISFVAHGTTIGIGRGGARITYELREIKHDQD
ncbi:hypothetical protein LCGC14_1121460 [marine sediment metagenome]|uniref:Lipoprotein n=1 Tax=marine sediment metagenome TaxID=412755 RepID=A0A0F9MRL3_9ZZZZ